MHLGRDVRGRRERHDLAQAHAASQAPATRDLEAPHTRPRLTVNTGVVIAALDRSDARHSDAAEAISAMIEERVELLVSTVTYAEALVRPAGNESTPVSRATGGPARQDHAGRRGAAGEQCHGDLDVRARAVADHSAPGAIARTCGVGATAFAVGGTVPRFALTAPSSKGSSAKGPARAALSRQARASPAQTTP